MAWNTPNSGFVSGSPITPGWMNGIGLDLRTWGGHVDAGNHSLLDVAAIGLNVQTLPGTAFNITAASWSGGIATVTIGSHSVTVNQVFTIASVAPTGYNAANVQATSVTSTTVSYTLTANPGTWTSGGTLTVFGPAAGWIAINPSGVLQYYNGSAWVSPSGSTGPGYYATSTSSLTIGTGSKTVVTQSGLAYVAGDNIALIDSANTANVMYGTVTSYSSNTLVMNCVSVAGSGTIATWNLSLTGIQGNVGSSVQAVANPWIATPVTSRAISTVYTNPSSTKDLNVLVTVTTTTVAGLQFYTDSSGTPTTKVGQVYDVNGSGLSVPIFFKVLPGNNYRFTNITGSSPFIEVSEWQ